jgi:preprotein translocase subunit SecG
MLYGILVTLFVVLSVFIVLIVLAQKSKGSSGLGGLGGSSQTLFGGSGGQDVLQKITWICVGLFMAGSLGLALYKTYLSTTSRYVVETEIPMDAPMVPDVINEKSVVDQPVTSQNAPMAATSDVPKGEQQ